MCDIFEIAPVIFKCEKKTLRKTKILRELFFAQSSLWRRNETDSYKDDLYLNINIQGKVCILVAFTG